MKKALTIAFAILTAVGLQAATISWMSGAITTSSGSKANATDNVANGYLFLVSEDVWNAFDVTSASAIAGYINADGSVAKTANATGTSTKKGLVNMTTEATKDDGYQYALVFYVDSANKVLATKGKDFINDVGSAEGVASAGLASNSYASSTWTTPSSGSSGDDVVPEPTTVALLALGLAAFGLKRKVA